MSFIEKDDKDINSNEMTKSEIDDLYKETYRCPFCYEIPFLSLKLDINIPVHVKVICHCMSKEYEINDFFTIYGKNFKGNIQCVSCKEFATKNNRQYKYCLECKEFFCAECQYIHLSKEEHYFICFQDIGNICSRHKKYFNGYCKKCRKNICENCYNKHSTHKIIDYNSIYISDIEMRDINSNFASAQLKVLIKDEETKEKLFSLLNDKDEFYQKDIMNLFQEHRAENLSILKFFKIILKIYNNSPKKSYRIIMNVKNNVKFDMTIFEIKPEKEKELDTDNLINRFYNYIKTHYIAKKSKEKIEQLKTDMDENINELYEYVLQNINRYLSIIDKMKPLTDGVSNFIHSPYKYKNFIYLGEFNEEEKMKSHGRGIMIYKNGEKYYGYFQKGKKNHYGIYFFNNGSRYAGEWANNKMEGYGKFFYSNSSIYEGYFMNNKRNGIGILTLSNGDRYEGEWENGNFLNYGKIIYKDGKKYIGEINNFIKEGYGKLAFPSGELYKGFFNKDEFSMGTYWFNNGNIYTGNFLHNKMNGYGKMRYLSFGEVYEGQMVLDKREGLGKYFYSNGDIYEGYWFDELRNGFGIIKFKDGDRYTGMFVKDRRHGIGIYYDKKKGEHYLGEWERDLKQGLCTLYNINQSFQGEIKKGIKKGMGFYEDNESLYSGFFSKNLFNGYGKIIYKSRGEVLEGLFKDGLPENSCTYFQSSGYEFTLL